MSTQIKKGNPEVDFSVEAARQPEILSVHPEIERVERMGRLLDAMTQDIFKDNLTICSFDMIETGKANAFAIYDEPDGAEVSNPVHVETKYRPRFGEDPTKRVWREESEVDEFLQYAGSKNQELLWERHEGSGLLVPKKNVLGYFVGFPTIEPQQPGKERGPIKDMLLESFLFQDQLYPGFIGGILTHGGGKSGLLMFKKSEKVEKVDTSKWGGIGPGDGVSLDAALPFMKMSGMVYSYIDLSFRKKRENELAEKYQQKIANKYAQRVAQAVEDIFD
jgi:hypothetical protein